ncbi:ArnT family glycosyltransferase [Leptospira hartskeerlii]|nr:glycosyltransferase family 39 protein [Leptospira hartskeerlii]
MGTAKTMQPGLFLLIRSISAFFGIGCILLTYAIANRLYKDRSIGIYSALAVACCPTIILLSKTITPDIFATFFVLVTLYFSISILEEGKPWQYIISGLFLGFTGSCKYNAVLIGIVIPAAHFLRTGVSGWKDLNLYKAVACSVLGFLFTTPYAYIEKNIFLFQLQSEAIHYSTEHPGMEGNTFSWYISYLWENLNFLFPFAILQIFIGLYRKNKETILLSAFVILYLGFVSTFTVRNDRTILPIIPNLLLLSFLFFRTAFQWIQSRSTKFSSASKWISLLPLGFILPLVISSVTIDMNLYSPKARNEARVWIEAEIPKNSKIALENYSPFVDPTSYKVSAFGNLSENTFDWYIKNEFDFLVLSTASFERYYKNPSKYPDKIKRYDEIFKSFTLIKNFSDKKEEIRIYQNKK